MNQILITNIQRFCLHDGPGIRTTIFLKGCGLRCPWCSNPENLSPYPQNYIKDGISGTYGKYYEPEELVKECLKDKDFYLEKTNVQHYHTTAKTDSFPGGVTFSGGECLLQAEQLVPVWQSLHNCNIHIAVETSLFVSTDKLSLALGFVDFFYVDMKILIPDQVRTIEGGNLDLYLANLDLLFASKKPAVIRVPVIGSYTDGILNRKAVYNLLNKYKESILKIELIKEHNLGESKYRSLNMKMDYHGVNDLVLEQYKSELEKLAITVEVCKI